MKKIIAALATAGALAAPAAAGAHGNIVSCRPSYEDVQYAASDIVTNFTTGCTFADSFAWSWQKADFAGKLHPGTHYVTDTLEDGQKLLFRMEYRSYPTNEDPVLRVQAFGTTGNNRFVSFETDQ
jgi:hypothetical protein